MYASQNCLQEIYELFLHRISKNRDICKIYTGNPVQSISIKNLEDIEMTVKTSRSGLVSTKQLYSYNFIGELKGNLIYNFKGNTNGKNKKEKSKED